MYKMAENNNYDDSGFSLFTQSLTIRMLSSDTKAEGIITIPSGKALILYELFVAKVSVATVVTFKLQSFDKIYTSNIVINNDILPIKINPRPFPVAMGNASIIVVQESTPVTSTNVFLVIGLLCNINDIERAKQFLYKTF